MADIGFICCTPYHVILAVYMSAGEAYTHTSKDIYICNHFTNAKQVYEKLKTMNLFQGVYYVEDKEINYGSKMKKFKKILKNDLGDITIPMKKYQQIHIFSFTFFSLVMSQMQKQQYNTKVILVEDGLMTYTLNKKNPKFVVWEVLSKIPFLKKPIFSVGMIDGIYLFRPELNVGNFPCEIEAIPMRDDYTVILPVLNQIFQYQPIGQEISKYVLFTQPLSEEKKENVRKVTTFIQQSLHEQITYKVHPRESVEEYQKNKEGVILETNAPWELIYMNERERFQRCVLISIHSTAVFSPSMMFQDDIRVVLLSQFVGEKNRLIEKFTETFAEKANLKHFKVLNQLSDLE